jgi:Folate receptor family
MTTSLFVLLLFLSLFGGEPARGVYLGPVQDYECPLTNRPKANTDGDDIGRCTWYEDESCCKNSTVTTVEELQGKECIPLNQACTDMVNMLLCSHCSPKQQEFTKSFSKVVVCKPFADSLFETCRRQDWKDPVNTDECAMVEETYDLSTDFLESNGFFVKGQFDTEPFENCFNMAPLARPPASLPLFAALAAALTVLGRTRS